MSSITEYYRIRIKALEDANSELRLENDEYLGYIYELTRDDSPEDYKRVIRHLIWREDSSQTHT